MDDNNDYSRHSSSRLGLVSYPASDKITPEQLRAYVEYVAAFVIDGTELPPTPEWYKPCMAYMQLLSMNPNLEVLPWEIPTKWIDRLSAVWIGNRLVNAELKRRQMREQEHDDDETHKGAAKARAMATTRARRGRSAVGGDA